MGAFAVVTNQDGPPSVVGAVGLRDGLLVGFHGFIANRADVAERLGDLRLLQADPERIVARLYRRFGAAFPAILDGEYAFAIVDRARGRIVAGRDAIGIGRLLLLDRGRLQAVATDTTVLEAAVGLLELDPEGLRTFLVDGGVPVDGSTVLRGVRHVPPAHVVALEPGRPARLRRYWAPAERDLGLDADAIDHAVRTLAADAVRSALPTGRAAWVDVSGGLDSSVVAALATGEARRIGLPDPVAFSVVHGHNADADESAYQDLVVGELGVRHVRFDADAHLDFEEPDGRYRSHPTNGMMQGERVRATRALMERERVQVRIAGLGGDQVFCGDDFPPVHLASLLRGRRWGDLAGELGRWVRAGERSAWSLLSTCVVSPVHSRTGRGSAAPSWVTPAVARAFAARPTREAVRARTFDDPAREVQWREIVDLASALDPCDAPWESRHPLLARPLVELLVNVPWDHKVGPRQDRILQRRAFRGLVPDRILDRAGKGDGTPRFLRGLRENWGRARRWAAGQQLADHGLVDPIAFRRGVERARHGLLGDDLPFYVAALSLEIWLELREHRTHPVAVAVGGTP